MKKLLQLNLAALAMLAAPLAQAFTYHDEDVLLIFRKPGFNNVEFNLGSVSQFLNKPAGYSINVTGWSLNLVTNTFGADLSGDVRVIVIASTSKDIANKRAWLGSAESGTQPQDRTSSQWQVLWSKISGVGLAPQGYTATSAVPSYVVSPTHISAYDFIASDGGVNSGSLPKLGGASTFVVEQAAPASLQFWEVKPSTVNPKPASTLVGTFTFGTNGALTFSTGSVAPPTIVGVTRTNGVSAVTFSTTAGGNYQLRFTNALGGAVTNWPLVGAVIAGDGSNKTLQHTNSDAAGFYSVVWTP